MGLSFRWLLNFVLLAIPIGTTLGILLGVQTHRKATGQAPLFVDNSVDHDQYCQKTVGISPPSKGEHFTLNPNQWGWDDGDPGHLCMNVTQFNNQTYPTKTTAPKFSVTWQYPPGPETQPVHAFPNAKIDSGVFPELLKSVGNINFDIAWTYGVGNDSASSTDSDALTADDFNANVAIDMFLDSDKTKSEDTNEAETEVMVWFAAFGAATQPIGFGDGIVVSEVLNGTTFDLYVGPRTQGATGSAANRQVLTWLASEPTEKFNGDIMPLMDKLVSMAQEGFPKETDYLGYMSLGSETLSATDPVTFSVPRLSIDVQTSS